jgi:hypothetical protein
MNSRWAGQCIAVESFRDASLWLEHCWASLLSGYVFLAVVLAGVGLSSCRAKKRAADNRGNVSTHGYEGDTLPLITL